MSNKLQLAIRSDAARRSIEETLKGRSDDFVTSLLTVANNNPLLQMCDPTDVIRAALKAASMRLPIDPNLGMAYILPYKNGKLSRERGEDVYDAQFQIGYKGFIQLALRSKAYKTLNATDVREGEYKGLDRLTGEIKFKWMKNEEARNKKKVVGYVSYMKLVGRRPEEDGFEKSLYMSVEDLQEHAKKYSQTYKKGYGKWVDDFNSMALKTVVKLLISKWGPLTTELETALRADQSAVDEDSYNYVDNQKKSAPSTENTIVEGEIVNKEQDKEDVES